MVYDANEKLERRRAEAAAGSVPGGEPEEGNETLEADRKEWRYAHGGVSWAAAPQPLSLPLKLRNANGLLPSPRGACTFAGYQFTQHQVPTSFSFTGGQHHHQ